MTRARLALLMCGTMLLPGTASAQAAQRFSTYRSSASCIGALMRAEMGQIWGQRDDTLPFNGNDMLSAAARDTAAACMRRFYPTPPDPLRAPEHEAGTLFFWGRATADDSLAARAFRRGLGLQKLRIDTTDVYWHGTYTYSSRPFRLAVAQEMAKRLDELGVVGERPMMPFSDHWESQHDGPSSLAVTLFDTTAMITETAGESRNYAALPDTARHGAELTGISSEGQRLLLHLVRNPRNDSAVASLKARAIEVLGENQQEGRWGEGLLLLGERWPALQPTFWFNRPAGDSVIPRPGRVTVIQEIAVQTCICEALYGSIRRLKQQFGDSVDIVILARTNGHWARRVQLTPAEEAGLLKNVLLDSLQLPITLGVYSTTFVPNPSPDDRLVPQVIPELKKISFSGAAIFVDRRGLVQMSGLLGFGPWRERAMAALIKSLLSAPAN